MLAAKWLTLPAYYVVKAYRPIDLLRCLYVWNPVKGIYEFYETIIPTPLNRPFPYGFNVEPDH